ncbi:MAG: hypothetical protein ACP5SB_00935 [Caldisericaceae bacterium]
MNNKNCMEIAKAVSGLIRQNSDQIRRLLKDNDIKIVKEREF